MAHLGLIQQQLNTDANYRARFRKDPVAALAEHGLLLSPEMQTQLRSMVTQAQVRPAGVAGAAFGAGGWGSAQYTKPWLSGGAAGKPLAGNEPGTLKEAVPLQTVPLVIFFE